MMTRCACITIGDLETAAGIGRDHESRFAFWRPFAPLGNGALPAAVAELHRLIAARLDGFTMPDTQPKRRKAKRLT